MPACHLNEIEIYDTYCTEVTQPMPLIFLVALCVFVCATDQQANKTIAQSRGQDVSI